MSTLQNFGVPLDGQSGNLLMPKPKNRFRVRVFNFGPVTGGLEFTQNVMTCSKVQMQHAEQEIHSYNSVAYYAGKATFSALEITLRDDVTNAVTRLVSHQMQKQMNHFTQTTPLAGANYKFGMSVEGLDGGEGVLESWTIEGGWIQSYNGGDWDYSSAEPSTIQLSVRFDNATQDGGLMPLIPQIGSGPLL